jgi:isopenicillin N synthase-like dioxygenase
MTAFAECLNLPTNTFVDMFKGGDFGTIRLLSYPEISENDAEKANIGISAHTDFEAFTLMHQDAAGLQFIPASSNSNANKAHATESDWVDAPVHKGEFVVIVGK